MAAARALVVSGNVTGIDHETFSPNETMQAPIFGRVILTQQDIPENFITLKKGWGGECRVEVTLTARLLAQQRVLVTVNGKLFEGTDESTGDLEDEQNASAVVPKGGYSYPILHVAVQFRFWRGRLRNNLTILYEHGCGRLKSCNLVMHLRYRSRWTDMQF
ncbi:hypothetical protein FOWG_17293 [Fusarium oxysporum f. sp. lycopersici MN25]|nr:hypothetical protein FOWG_17293 [Fusarium oxysporum f. sp. lycopersici MN25]